MNQPATCSLSDFAGIAGFKRGYVTQLKKDGRLVLTEDGKRVCVPESLAQIAATRDPSKAGVVARHAANRAITGGEGAAVAPVAPPAGADAASDPDEDRDGGYQHSRAMKERYQAMGAKRDYLLSIGQLMDAGEVEAAIAGAVTVFRTSFEGMPPRLGPQLAAISDEAQSIAVLAEAFEHALDEVSRQFFNLAKAAA